MQVAFNSSTNVHVHGVATARNMQHMRRNIASYQKSCRLILRAQKQSDFIAHYPLISGAETRSRIRLALARHRGFLKPLNIAKSLVSYASYQSVRCIHSSSSVEDRDNLAGCDPVEKLRSSFNLLRNTAYVDENVLGGLVRTMFPFEMDQFQLDSLKALGAGRSVVLSAPTGAGKTVVGEIAVYLALCREMRIFYTTPLKALSNQKYYDFKRLFGDNRVGLLTGDQTINREGDVLIMTTEVYRNMLYADATEPQQGSPATHNLYAVVFDEFHYLNDRDRGTVWEESVINSSPDVLLVALSATMSNTEDIRDWFAAVQGPTELIRSGIRPVPLSFSYFDSDGITPLFEDSKGKRSQGGRRGRGFKRRPSVRSEKSEERDAKLHPKLLRKLREAREAQRPNETKGRRQRAATAEEVDNRQVTITNYKEISRRRGKSRNRFKELPSFPFVVRGLRKRDMLPCIIFIFSRAGCDRAAMAASTENYSLVSLEERREIKARLDTFVEKQPGMVPKERLNLALQGIASHHAGLLPLWKICVEEMFQDGLLKVIFATETLAAGINMPARTTVISSLSKRVGDNEFALLTTSEVLQMAGRAGRRGKDTLGYSVILKSRNEGPMEAFKLLTAPVDTLESKFSPSYGMVLNLLSARPITAVKTLVNRSFGNFLRRKELESALSRHDTADNTESGSFDIDTIQRERNALESVLREAKDFLASSDEKLLRSYVKGIERVKAERRALMYLMKQGEAMNAELVEETLTFAPTGTKLLLRDRRTSRSTGQERRQRRREYSSAIAAAANGDFGQELMSFYLDPRDPELELLDAGESDDDTQEVDAVLLDMHAESTGILPTFAAVGADGCLRLFNHTAVSQILYDSDPIDVDAHAPGWRDEPLPHRSVWQSVDAEQYKAPLPDCLQSVVHQVKTLRQVRSGSGTNVNNAMDNSARYEGTHGPEIVAQRERLEHAKQFVRNHKLHGKDNTPTLLAAKRAIPKIEATLDGRYDPFGNKRRQGRSGTFKRYLTSRSTTENGAGKVSVSDSSWDEFMSLVSVLQHYGFLDENYSVTSLGALGAKVRSENELWSSLMLMDPHMENVSPVSLGAILGSTLMETTRSDVYVAQEVSQEVKQSLSQAAQERVRLFAIQKEHGVEEPIGLDAELMGLVELWASGVSWVELLSNTSLQEGDVCRILRRVLDMLRQIQHLPVVSSSLKRNAKRAIALLDRFPVTDDLTFTIQQSEKLGDDDGDE